MDQETKDKLPRYICHKQVNAGKIGAITIAVQVQDGPVDDFLIGVLPPGVDVLSPGVELVAVRVPRSWKDRHNPEIGGYLIAYDDGYLSYSPAEAFEAGYSIIGDIGPRDALGRVLVVLLDGKRLSTCERANLKSRHVRVMAMRSADDSSIQTENGKPVCLVGRCDELALGEHSDDPKAAGMRVLNATELDSIPVFPATEAALLARGFVRVAYSPFLTR